MSSKNQIASSYPSASLEAIELEEAVLGAILLDPEALALVQGLPKPAFSISAYRQIFCVMLDLHAQGLQPDLPTVAYKLAELGILEEVGGKSKLVTLLDRTVHSGQIRQYAHLLKDKYYRRYLSNSLSRIAQLPTTESDLTDALKLAQEQLDQVKRVSVTDDSHFLGDSQSLDSQQFLATVTSVTTLLSKGMPDWEEQAHLDVLQSGSGMSKASFAQLVAALRCRFDEVMPEDRNHFDQLVDWHSHSLDFNVALPHIANDLLHDAAVLNVDPICLWQYLLPATLSLVGKKCDLDVHSHSVPAIAWTCSVGESGTGKSRAEGVVLAALKQWQQSEFQRFSQEFKEFKNAKSSKGESDPEVELPDPERKYLFEVATIQAVMRRLSEQGENGSLWARDEIAGLFKSLGQFSSNGDGEGLECLLKMWDGSPTQVDRMMHEDSYNMLSTRLSLAGGIQPGVFRQIFKDADDANGMQARFLFALPKVRPAKRVKGSCQLAAKLPDFYRWVDQDFPTGTLKLSRAADARYDAVYEQIGIQAELGNTPAIRVWMRKLPGQLLRIALALHVIECFHEPGRPKHEIQLDTLNRAVEVTRYYRSVFQVIQESVADSDNTSSILLKIWDMAASSPTGIVVRDTYRRIKAIQRRAKELGRNVAAYTIDLYHELEKMGRGVVKRDKRQVRFEVGTRPQPPTPSDPVTVETVAPTQTHQAFSVSPIDDLSSVTVEPVKEVEDNTKSEQSVNLDLESLSTAPTTLSEELPSSVVLNASVPIQSASVLEGLGDNSTGQDNVVSELASDQNEVTETFSSALTIILQCQTWVEIIEAVEQDTQKLIQATSQMTWEQRRHLTPLLAAHLCQNPTALNQLAWVPSKLRERALELLSFTIERIGGASILDACVEKISGCKFVAVQRIGTRHEHWVFRCPLSGQNIPVFDIEAIEAIALG